MIFLILNRQFLSSIQSIGSRCDVWTLCILWRCALVGTEEANILLFLYISNVQIHHKVTNLMNGQEGTRVKVRNAVCSWLSVYALSFIIVCLVLHVFFVLVY